MGNVKNCTPRNNIMRYSVITLNVNFLPTLLRYVLEFCVFQIYETCLLNTFV